MNVLQHCVWCARNWIDSTTRETNAFSTIGTGQANGVDTCVIWDGQRKKAYDAFDRGRNIYQGSWEIKGG